MMELRRRRRRRAAPIHRASCPCPVPRARAPCPFAQLPKARARALLAVESTCVVTARGRASRWPPRRVAVTVSSRRLLRESYAHTNSFDARTTNVWLTVVL